MLSLWSEFYHMMALSGSCLKGVKAEEAFLLKLSESGDQGCLRGSSWGGVMRSKWPSGVTLRPELLSLGPTVRMFATYDQGFALGGHRHSGPGVPFLPLLPVDIIMGFYLLLARWATSFVWPRVRYKQKAPCEKLSRIPRG